MPMIVERSGFVISLCMEIAHGARLTSLSFCAVPLTSSLLEFWIWGYPDLPACGPRCGSIHGLVWPTFINTNSRPSRGPSLAGRTTRSFLRHGLVRLAHEEAESSRWGTSRGAHDARHDDQGRQAGASPRSVLLFLFGAKGASAAAEYRGIRQRLPFRCNETKTRRTTRWRSPWSPRRRHH